MAKCRFCPSERGYDIGYEDPFCPDCIKLFFPWKCLLIFDYLGLDDDGNPIEEKEIKENK